MRRTYQLYANERPGYIITNCEYTGGANDIQFRIDIARAYDVKPGEGYFTVKENGIIINKLDIPS